MAHGIEKAKEEHKKRKKVSQVEPENKGKRRITDAEIEERSRTCEPNREVTIKKNPTPKKDEQSSDDTNHRKAEEKRQEEHTPPDDQRIGKNTKRKARPGCRWISGEGMA